MNIEIGMILIYLELFVDFLRKFAIIDLLFKTLVLACFFCYYCLTLNEFDLATWRLCTEIMRVRVFPASLFKILE